MSQTARFTPFGGVFAFETHGMVGGADVEGLGVRWRGSGTMVSGAPNLLTRPPLIRGPSLACGGGVTLPNRPRLPALCHDVPITRPIKLPAFVTGGVVKHLKRRSRPNRTSRSPYWLNVAAVTSLDSTDCTVLVAGNSYFNRIRSTAGSVNGSSLIGPLARRITHPWLLAMK